MSARCPTGKVRWRRRAGAHRKAKALTAKNRRAPVSSERSGLEAAATAASTAAGGHIATRNPRPVVA